MGVAATSHTQHTNSNPFLRSIATACRSVPTEEAGAEFARVRGDGVAEMNRAEEIELVPEDVFDFEPEERAERTLHLLARQDVVEKKEHAVERFRFHADPREQILALYDEYRPRLFRYIRSLRLNRDQAEEVIQETFMRLTTGLLRQDDFENVQGWIVRVAHNLTVDALKKQGRDTARSCENTEFELERRIDPTLSPEEVFLEKEQKRRMDAALATFNPQQRQCFQMRVQGFQYKEIGMALGISEQRAAFVLKKMTVRLAAICG